MRVRLVDNRFIGMDDAVAQIVDITTLASFKTFGNQIEGQTGPRFSRNEVNINGMNGAVLDVDGSLFGEGVPSIFTTGRQNPASVDRPDMNGFITRVADITGWGWGFFAPGLDGATLPADAVRLAVRSVSLPADEIRRRGFVTIGERSWPLTLSQAGEVTVTLDGLAPGWHMAFLHGDQNTNWMWTNWGPRMDILVFQVSGSAPQNQAPVVALTAPANGATAVTPATIALAADASDPDGSIASVAFFVGGTQISSDSSAPYTATWSPTAAGTYQLTARATDNLGAVTVSAARSVTVSLGSGLPSGYTAQDIGAVAAAGSTSESDGTWTLKGSGADIWNNADEFQFAWRQVTGDVQITARVASLQNTHQWAKAGVMIRESLAPGSRHASTFVTPGNGTCHQRRSVTDGSSGHTAGPKGAAPMWVRIERVGTMLISSSSADGTT